MQHTRTLRTHFASVHCREALALARQQRWTEALEAAEQASSLDPMLPYPHVIAAKVHFWRGELREARGRLREATARGLAAAEESAMSACIGDLEARITREHDARTHSRARNKALATESRRAISAAFDWFNERRLTEIAFYAALFALLVFGGLR